MATVRSLERKGGGQTQAQKTTGLSGHGPKSVEMSVGHSSMVDMEDEEVVMKLEDQLTNDKLKELQEIFEEADEDGGGGLDMDEFRTAMRKAMGEHLTDHDLDIIFMKVDTNCDGTVDWDEYLSYMLLEYRGKDDMNFETKPKPLPKYMKKVPHMNRYQRHHDSIVGLTYLPNVVKASNTLYRFSEDPCGRYLSLTKEGVVNFWNIELGHLKSFRVGHNMRYQRKISVWVTDFVCMPNLNMLCVATTSSNLTFYDLTANKFCPVLTITGLEICATCMDYWVDPDVNYRAQLLWGDARGNISGLVFDNCLTVCFLQPGINKHFQSKVAFNDIANGSLCGVKAYKLQDVHEDFVLRIKYVPTLNSFLSCCRGRNTSLFQGCLQRKKAVYFKVRKGVFAFDYCPQNNVLVTGGKDTVVRVWNPYVQSKPVMILQGHKSAILFVMVNNKKEQIISISEDKDINIFDMSTQTCVQTIYRKWVPLGPRPIAAAYFNQHRQALLIATNQMAIFEHRDEEIETQMLTSHPKPVTVALYNSLFNQVVSGGMDSRVCVWDANTGERTIQFVAHTKRNKGGEEIGVEITSMRFDPTLRRLITAARDGSVKVWNFNNGACLRELEMLDTKEITGIIVARQRIVTAGWNRDITVHVDSSEDESVVHWRSIHREDILALALLSPGTIASASYDGDIILWNLDNGNAFNLFNASESSKPLFISSRMSDQKLHKASACKRSQSDPNEEIKEEQFDTQEDTKPTDLISKDQLSNDTTPSEPGQKNVSFGHSRRKNNGKSVDTMVFLKTREVTRHGANLVAAGAEGWIRFWSIHAEGGLLGQFHGGHHAEDAITALATDEHNEFLVTGDSSGYIKVWDISEYCITSTHVTPASCVIDRRDNFVLLKDDLCTKQWRERHSKVTPPPEHTQPQRTWKDPPLLASFHAHLLSISYLDYIEKDDKLLSCSADCSIRMWTVYGEFLGIFGQEVPWGMCTQDGQDSSLSNVKVKTSANSLLQRNREYFRKEKQKALQKIPGDIRRVASATTMRVMFSGARPQWKLAKNILTVWLPLLRMSRKSTAKSNDTSASQCDLLDVDVSSDTDLRLLPSMTSNASNSGILGKHFKSNRKHQETPKLPKIRQFNNLCDVYSALSFHELEPVNSDMQPPQCLIEMRERQKTMMQTTRKTRALFKVGAFAAKMQHTPSTVDSRSQPESRSKSTKPVEKSSDMMCGYNISQIQ